MPQYSFQDLKQHVGIDDVAYSLGYKLNRQAGVGRYIELMLPDGKGQKLDTIVISHPQQKERQRFFHRNGSSRGDVVDFVGENLSHFNKFGRNQWEVIAKVLADYANMPLGENADRNYANTLGYTPVVFNPKRYVAEKITDNHDYAKAVFAERGISESTLSVFSNHIKVVTDMKYKQGMPMIGFPYQEAGFDDELKGYELRGERGFKGKAAGTNSTTAMWIAGIPSALNNPENVRHVYFSESAYDAMAFYQANEKRIDLTHSAFVSIGGALSNGQVNGAMRHFKYAKAVDCFDNDLAGRIYGMRMAGLVDGKRLNIVKTGDSLRIEADGKKIEMPVEKASVKELTRQLNLSGRTEVWKPPSNYKDWNDVVRQMPMEALELKTKFQRDEHLSKIRQEMRQRKEPRKGMRL